MTVRRWCNGIALAAAALLVAAPAGGRAQQTPPAPADSLPADSARADAAPADTARRVSPFVVGQRVRVLVPVLGFEKVVGTVDSLREGVVVLDTTDRGRPGLFGGGPVMVERYRRVAINVGDLRSVEVSTGRNRVSAMLRYAGIGLLAGAVLGGVFNSPQFNPTWADFRGGMIPGAIIGTLGGGYIGYRQGRELWSPIPGPYIVRPRPGPERRTE